MIKDMTGFKEDLKRYIRETLVDKASAIFLKRALGTIDQATDEKEGLLSAADKVGKLVALFVDENVGNKLSADLKAKIDVAA
jgi:hypothetical protein